MNETARVCDQCGSPVPAEAPGGLCPRCLLQGVADPTDPGVDGTQASEVGRPGGRPVIPPPPDLAVVAEAFPQLEILGLIGQGGMGVVYRARQKSLNRLVALKLLAPHRAHDETFAARFAQEARALAALNHPHIVTIHDFGRSGGFYFLLMEFVDGVNLRQLLKSRRLSPEEALAIVPSLCEALQFAHDHGIVHRDIKPENLLLDQSGRVKIADFGIARMLGSDPVSPHSTEGETQGAGTPGYMAPEQKAAPKTADSRADIYSLGVVLYEMLTGELPASRLQPPSRRVRLDVRLDEIVLRALEHSPERRYQTAHELGQELETVVTVPAAAAAAAAAAPVPGVVPSPAAAPAPAGVVSTANPGDPARAVASQGTAPPPPWPTPSPAAPEIWSSRARRAGVGVLLILGIAWIGLVFLVQREGLRSEWVARTVGLLSAFTGVSLAVLLRRVLVSGWRPARPSFLRVVAAGLLAFFGIFAVGARWAALNREGVRDRAVSEERMAASRARLAVAAVHESELRKKFEKFETGISRGPRGSDLSDQPELTESYLRWTRQVREAREAKRLMEVDARESGRCLEVLQTAGSSRGFRAMLPMLPVLLGVAALLLRGRRSEGHAQERSSSRRRRVDVALALGSIGAAVMLMIALDRSYSKNPEAFEANFASPTRPELTGLGWSAVSVSNSVLFVEVETQLGRWSAEARWEFFGPNLPTEMESALGHSLEPRPPGIVLQPTRFPGNATWTMLKPGRQVTQLAFVFPDAELAGMAFREFAAREFTPVQPGETLEGTWFHVFRPVGQEYRASFRISTVFHSGHPDWVTLSRFGSWNESALNFTWTLNAARGGQVTLESRDDRTSTWIAGRKGELVEVPIRLELARSGTNRVRLSFSLAGSKGYQERLGDYRTLVEEILRTATSGTKSLRGMPTELCRVDGKPVIVRIEDGPAGPSVGFATGPTSGVETRTFPPNRGVALGLPLFALLALLTLFAALGGGVVLLLRHRQRGGAGRIVALLLLGGAVLFLLLILLFVGLWVS